MAAVLVTEVKGSLAAIARVQMEAGLGREQAAALVARKVPAELASRLSSKRFITGRAIEEYMDLYDCGSRPLEKFEQGRERKRFISIFGRQTRNDDGSVEAVRRYFRADMRQRSLYSSTPRTRMMSSFASHPTCPRLDSSA